MSDKRIVILIGPPGSGKGTQAELLAKEFGFYHLESSNVIEQKFVDAAADDEVINTEKKKWRSGELNSPALVREWIMERVEQLAQEGRSIVFSGSPRTLYEVEAEELLFARLYGPQNIHVFNLKLSKEESIRRNSGRRICKANRHPIQDTPENKDLTVCQEDGSELVVRELDKPDTIAFRYDTYLKQTSPVLGFLEGKGHHVTVLDGTGSVEAVHAKIVQAVELGREPVPQN
jgi:adenylate kinase